MIWFGGVMLPADWLVLESLRASEGHMSLAVLGVELAVPAVGPVSDDVQSA